MSIDTKAPHSRRTLLAGAFAAAGGALLAKLGSPSRVEAATGQAVIAGQANSADEPTALTNTASGEISLDVASTGDGIALRSVSPGGGAGVVGIAGTGVGFGNADAGVVGWNSNGGSGVLGQAEGAGGYGVQASSSLGDAVRAFAGAAGTTAIYAAHGETSGSSSPPYDTGVYGYHGDESGAGVWGESSDGTGVIGTGAVGVYASGQTGLMGDVYAGGTGVYGFVGDTAPPNPPGGRAVYARAATTSQFALETVGKVKFNRSAKNYVSAGASSKRITMAGVTSSSYVIATLQTNRAGYYIQSVVCATGYFTVYLNKAVPGTTYFGYLVIN